MRICFLGGFSAGGTEKVTSLIANIFSKTHDVFVLNSCSNKPSFDFDERIRFDYLEKGSVLKRNIALYKYLKKNNIDLLITIEALTGIFSLIPSRLARCKHIVWDHANYYQTQSSKHMKRIRQLELKLANAYIVLTKRDLNNFKNNFKIKRPINYIYNPIDFISKAEYDFSSKTIISAGHISEIKNFIIIPDIAKIVFSKHPDWQWKIYGEKNGEKYEQLERKIHEYGLENHIILCGRSTDMSHEYRNAAIYVLTSLQEGLPMVLLEAKAHKLPIVSFDIETGPDEIVDDGVNGFLVEPYNVEEMAEKINLLIEDESLRKQFSGNSKIGIEKFDKDVITEKWKNLLESI